MERRKKEMAEFFLKTQERGFAVEPLGTRSAYINGSFVFNAKRAGTTPGQARTNILTFVFISLQVGLISMRGNCRMAAF
jgi:hypothetical protein